MTISQFFKIIEDIDSFLKYSRVHSPPFGLFMK